MSARHLNVMFPQWQGGGPDISTFSGAWEFRKLYLADASIAEIAVDTQLVTETENLIFGYQTILRQMRMAHNLIRQEAPDTVFTLGGSCDADVPAIAYLNRKLSGDLTVLWIDSHGDLNTPLSSPSTYFYGMPLRVLLGDGDRRIVEELPSTLLPRQVVLLGARDLDIEEQAYVRKHSLPIVSVEEMELTVEAALRAVRSGDSGNLYIHIDLDVLDPAQFPYVPLPVPGGLRMDTLQTLLRTLRAEFRVAGLGLMEYQPTGERRYPLFEEICKLLPR
jgi:arginase